MPPSLQKPTKTHTRSRTGCLTCRKRHQKCDERRPICGNCVTVDKPCEYSTAVLPLREKRKKFLPGEQQPWKPADGTVMTMSQDLGPCISSARRPITMAFKSDELFHYFYKLEDPSDIAPKKKRQDLLASVTHSADALRNTMLIASLHYAWNAGHLRSFEPTLLFHKLEAMRLINKSILDSDAKYSMCVKHIATLCLTECALGNITAAETHMDGLMKFMDFHRPTHLPSPTEPGLDDELANRYIILTYNFIHGFKSRVKDILLFNDTRETPSPEMVEELMHSWHKTEMQGLDIRLKSLKMLPFFFSELPPSTEFIDVDGEGIVDCLVTLTATSRLRSESPDPFDQNVLWQEGAATRLLLAFVNTHIESISGGRKTSSKRARLASSWSGLATATGLYLHAILQFWNAGEPMKPPLHRRILHILQQDLEGTRHHLGSRSRLVSKLWFWKAFVGAMSVERHVAFDTEGVLVELGGTFREFVRGWSIVVGVTQWGDAREALRKIAWPGSFESEYMARDLWYRCVATQ
ncbi:Ff.00g036740.m01.CDS01 [Fusarium sp. VM40]|nr:Ff.00g036740.m01.CDS01 [Fusarium sp. VM40]